MVDKGEVNVVYYLKLFSEREILKISIKIEVNASKVRGKKSQQFAREKSFLSSLSRMYRHSYFS